MCHPLTPREATQAPVAKAALAKVSSTTATCILVFQDFIMTRLLQPALIRRGAAETTLYLSVRRNTSLGGAKKLHEVFLSSNPGRVTSYNDRHFSYLSRVPPANTETGSGKRLGATHSKSLSKHYSS
jgi:hypothetical protein